MTWRERIVAARALGKFTKEDIELASNWCSCAVGEQRQRHPDIVIYMEKNSRWDVDNLEEPQDDRLRELGSNFTGFYFAVRKQRVAEAESLLDAIEDRVLQLKREAQP